MTVTANVVRALKREFQDKAVLLIPEECYDAIAGAKTEIIDSLIDKRILFGAGRGNTRITVAVPCLNYHSDSWNYDTARILCRRYSENGYYTRVDPRMEQYGDKKFFLVTIDWGC